MQGGFDESKSAGSEADCARRMEHERFLKRWKSVQSRFVDSPKGAVTEGDDLVSSLMKTRGYPRDTSSTPQPTSEAPAQRLHPICSFRMYFASAVSST